MLARRKYTFRVTLTTVAVSIIASLSLVLIFINLKVFSITIADAIEDSMNAAEKEVSASLQFQFENVLAAIHLLSVSSGLADNDRRSEVDRAIEVFRESLKHLSQVDGVHVGYETGAWLQLQRLNTLNQDQRERLKAPPGAEMVVALIRPTASGALPLRRRFLDRDGGLVSQVDLWNYGYDARKRFWYQASIAAEETVISSPYLSYSTGAPMVTLSTALHGMVDGVVAMDVRMDNFIEFVASQDIGGAGEIVVFAEDGALLAHRDYQTYLDKALSRLRQSTLPNVDDIRQGTLANAVALYRRDGVRKGTIMSPAGEEFYFRGRKIDVPGFVGTHIVMLAPKDSFAQNIRVLRDIATAIAIVIGLVFFPVTWLIADRMSASIRAVTRQAERLQTMDPPTEKIASKIVEIQNLADAVNLAQHAIWSFSRFVPKEMVRSLLAKTISTELGGVRREISVIFTDVQNFTEIAESSDPDVLMNQTSRYFTAITRAFLAEGGTIDKFIGDAVMVFWNAPTDQPNHVFMACRAALAAKAASEAVNVEFERQGLRPFVTRFGVSVGEATVGNLGSHERMDYTALGNTVNLAARLQTLNKELGTSILVSEQVARRAGDAFWFVSRGSMGIKGMSAKASVFELTEKHS